MELQKVVLALGDRAAESYLEERQNDYRVVGITSHRGGVHQQLAHHNPQVLVIRDNLPGKEDFLQLIFRIRGEFPDLIIIVLAHGRQAGDPLLTALVNYGVHNILYGDGINLNRVIELFEKPMNYSDVQHLQPMTAMNEETDRITVEAIGPPVKITVPHEDLKAEADVSMPDLPAEHAVPAKPAISVRPVRNARPAVVACWGAARGMGSSTLAMNLAVVFATYGYRTILLELDHDLPTIGIWLSLYGLDKGTETALRDPADFEEAVINRQTNFPGDTGHAGKILKKLPPELELLVFSQSYLVNENTKSPGGREELRNLLTALVFQHLYDVVILDLGPGLDHPLTTAGLGTSSHILCSVTGDIALMAHTGLALEKMPFRAPGAEKRLQIVYNRDAGNDVPDFTGILGREADFNLPETAHLTSALALTGLPAVLDNRYRPYREAVELIAGEINPVALTRQAPLPGPSLAPGLLKKILGR